MTTAIADSLEQTKGDAGASATSDVLHERGLQHLQAGEWEAAIQCFAELTEQHPEQESYARLLAEAKLKAKLGDKLPRRRTGHHALRSRWVWFFLSVNLVLWLAVFGRQLYQQQILPSIEQHRANLRQQQLLKAAHQHLIAGEYDQAEELYNEVLRLGPDNAAAQAALEELERRRQLTQSYNEAVALLEQDEWESALEKLEAIRQEDPSFQDVQAQIERAQRLREKSTILYQADTLVKSGEYRTATRQLLTLRQEAPDFKPEAVNKLLVEIYVKQAEGALSKLVKDTARDIGQLQEEIGSLSELVRGTTKEIEQLREAVQYFKQALEIDPADQQAATQATLAQEYLAGLEAYRSGSWELASIHLANVYPAAPSYSNGRVAILLQASFVQNGIRYLKAEQYEQAAERLRQAIAVSLAGDGLPASEEVVALLPEADKLARENRYREAVALYAQILIKIGFQEIADVVTLPVVRIENVELVHERATTETASEETGREAAPTSPIALYVVRPNDTLSAIAARFDTTVAALLAANPFIQNADLIRPGWRLRIVQP